MRVKLDENIPADRKPVLADLGHLADTVAEEGLQGRPDADVWAAAQGASCFLITQDLDFSDLRKYPPGTHHGIMLLRLREPGREALIDRVRLVLEWQAGPLLQGCLVVVSENRIRIRRPPY